jgi:hypothetical protein
MFKGVKAGFPCIRYLDQSTAANARRQPAGGHGHDLGLEPHVEVTLSTAEDVCRPRMPGVVEQ